MYPEADLLPLSAVQHFVYCPRQCALIHLERVWDENLFTAEGRVAHERVHAGGREARGTVRRELGLALRSLALGLAGQADVVEFHREGGAWRPFPVEHKRGRPKAGDCDRVQLCAQAMCLEEMLGTEVPAGALFYGATRRRQDVAFDPDLRRETEEAARALHELFAAGETPRAEYSKARCGRCSLLSRCLPGTISRRQPVRDYLARMLSEP